MQLKLPPERLLASCAVEGVETVLQALPFRSGAELSFATVAAVRDAMLAGLDAFDGFVLLCGTDTLEEAAFLLHLMLGEVLRRRGTPLCLTGAMLPADQLGCDGAKNLRDAIKVWTNKRKKVELCWVGYHHAHGGLVDDLIFSPTVGWPPFPLAHPAPACHSPAGGGRPRGPGHGRPHPRGHE
jgi:hypothetical protein